MESFQDFLIEMDIKPPMHLKYGFCKNSILNSDFQSHLSMLKIFDENWTRRPTFDKKNVFENVYF